MYSSVLQCSLQSFHYIFDFLVLLWPQFIELYLTCILYCTLYELAFGLDTSYKVLE